MADAIDAFFDRYEPDVAKLAAAARAAVRRTVPDASEHLYTGWKVVTYSHGKRRICAIAPHKAWVNLQFHSGALLDDPDGLLTGTGKRMRHVRIEKLRDLNRAALRRLLTTASDHAGGA